jgi:hypothetical protein
MAKLLMHYSGNLGYAADQVHGQTLGEILEAVQLAIDEYGEDAEVVLYQGNNYRGANYGRTASALEMFELAEDES